jgi:hypothetical protein
LPNVEKYDINYSAKRYKRVGALISSLQPPVPCTEKQALASVVENGLTKSQYINMKEEQK